MSLKGNKKLLTKIIIMMEAPEDQQGPSALPRQASIILKRRNLSSIENAINIKRRKSAHWHCLSI